MGTMTAARSPLGTKAESLERLRPRLRSAEILPLFHFTVGQWQRDAQAVLDAIAALDWPERRMIVRSSCQAEDQATQSHAGRYLSLAHVDADGLKAAIAAVVDSYTGGGPTDQVLIQPMCGDVAASGVVFTCDPNTRSPYVVVNYESGSGDTAAVTGGRQADLRTFVFFKKAPRPADPLMAKLAGLVDELEALTGIDALDLEFAQRGDGTLILFQVRPLVISGPPPLPLEQHRTTLDLIAKRVAIGMVPDPFIHGRRTVYGVMPDWNPAEIIGIRPRPLALSLYRDLVTDSIWAYQRHNYGYKNLRSCPLLVHFHGLPYIDVRVSFNSFVPAGVNDDLADRLVNYYIDRLLEAPHLHDKVEFEIIFSCYTPTLRTKMQDLTERGFRPSDLDQLEGCLRGLTNTIINNKKGLWRADLDKLTMLEHRRQRIMNLDTDPITRVYWLLEDCKRYGSLPFAGLARAGFIAVQLLRSLVDIGVLDHSDYAAFMASLNSVSRRMSRDFRQLGRTEFLHRYGHLRPGTYDMLSRRYDEAPDLYFNWDESIPEYEPAKPFVLSLKQMRAISEILDQHGIDNDVVNFFEFIEAGIEGREYSKFLFTKNLSDAMEIFQKFGAGLGFGIDDMSYANIGLVKELYASSADPRDLLAASIQLGRAQYDVTRSIILPPIINGPEQVWSFEIPRSEPNYITLGTAMGPVADYCQRDRLAGAVVMIPNADPGYDWLFSLPIAGFVTAYGGANSHMAIRAAELGLPAVIGAGETLFNKWSKASILAIDCANRTVSIIR